MLAREREVAECAALGINPEFVRLVHRVQDSASEVKSIVDEVYAAGMPTYSAPAMASRQPPRRRH